MKTRTAKSIQKMNDAQIHNYTNTLTKFFQNANAALQNAKPQTSIYDPFKHL